MKNLKKSIAMVVFLFVLIGSTGSVLAYNNGEGDIDPRMEITMPSDLSSEGTGNVSGTSGAMKYQFVEITEDKYNEIKKLEDQYELITVYLKYQSDENTYADEYDAVISKYESKYNEKVTSVYNQYETDLADQSRTAWIKALTEYDSSKWESANGSTIKLDLSTFKGTKHFIGWIQAENNAGQTVMDAEVYKATGTKKDEVPDNTVPDNTIPENKVPENTVPENKVPENTVPENKVPENEVPKNITPTNTTPKPDNTTNLKKEDPTTSNAKDLPYTGSNHVLFALTMTAIAVAFVFYKKYMDI